MTTVSLHPRPTYRAIAKEQVCSVGLALRKEGIFFLAFLAIVAILSLVSVLHSTPHAVHESANGCASMSGGHDDGPMDLLTMALIPIGAVAFVLPFGLAGFIVPFGVWRSDDLARRSYHWAMPTVRGSHTLI
ncbi:MAG TPA: hypothetical protein VNU46_04045, partial [Gemmatimonadaceae bacterium]|nr:hypothetical protein [Gemmatimonadaceae bacterium]